MGVYPMETMATESLLRQIADPSSSTKINANMVVRREEGRGQYDRKPDWQRYSFVQIVVGSLPLGVTTLDIYQNFQRFGNVSRIAIFDRRQGDWSTRAEVQFE